MTKEKDELALPTAALVVSILLFAGIYLWGFVIGIAEMAKSAPASPGAAN